MARMSNIDYQMYSRMDQMKCIGESRDDAIKQTSIEFIRHLKVEHKRINDVS